MSVTFQRLLSRGELPDSAGGLYNPSVWTNANGQASMIVRREVNYLWDHPSYPTVVNLMTKAHHTLTPVGFQAGARIEDCRAFLWRGQTLVSHVDYFTTGKRAIPPVRQRLSVIHGDAVVKWDDWHLPVPLQPIEKNWVLGSMGDDLFCVYSLDPFVVCRRAAEQQWEMVHGYPTGLTERIGQPPRNSTHLVPFDDGCLGFYHYFVRDQGAYVYRTGAYWLDEHLKLEKWSDVLVDGSWARGTDLYKPGVVYVSSALIDGEMVRLFYGEGDSHSGVATIPVQMMREALRGVR